MLRYAHHTERLEQSAIGRLLRDTLPTKQTKSQACLPYCSQSPTLTDVQL